MSQTPDSRRANMVRVAGVLLLLLMCGGGYYAYEWINAGEEGATQVETAAIDNAIKIPRQRPGGGGGAGSAVANVLRNVLRGEAIADEQVVKNGRGVIYARRGSAYLKADANAAGGFNIELKYILSVRQSWGTPEQHAAELNATALMERPALAKAVELTPQQRQQLAALPPADVVLTAAQKQQIEPLLTAWDKAQTKVAKKAAEAPLLTAVNQIGTAQLATVKAAAQQRFQKIPTILTADQMTKVTRALNPPPPPPTTKPAVSPAATTTKPAVAKPAAAPAPAASTPAVVPAATPAKQLVVPAPVPANAVLVPAVTTAKPLATPAAASPVAVAAPAPTTKPAAVAKTPPTTAPAK